MKILSTKQQQQADAYTIKHEPISSINLMERASKRFVENAIPFLKDNRITVFAGIGNNGGDGLAIARILSMRGYSVKIIHACFGKTLSKDCQVNLNRLPTHFKLLRLDTPKDFDSLEVDESSVFIDAIFGSGLTRPIKGDFAKVVAAYNKAKAAFKISVDIPSGLFADNQNNIDDPIIESDITITFQAPKLSFFFPESSAHVGRFVNTNIDLKSEFIDSLKAEDFLITEHSVSKKLRRRSLFSHKGTFGHLGVVKGSSDTLGASYLAALAGFSSGCGLVSLLDFEETLKLKQWPHLMHKKLTEDAIKSHCICVGPGLGTNSTANQKLAICLKNAERPMLLDADALNLLANQNQPMSLVPAISVLTPHPKELERLIGRSKNSFEQLDKAKAFAKKHNIILLIKRANTVVVSPDGKAFFNTSGNPSLAKAGSGDVLSGIIASFMCQGYEPIDAAILGVYIHGKAADELITEISEYSLTPDLLVSQLGNTIKNLGV